MQVREHLRATAEQDVDGRSGKLRATMVKERAHVGAPLRNRQMGGVRGVRNFG